jgi:hypothetical protein
VREGRARADNAVGPNLAALNDVESRSLVRAVKGNRERFPEKFMVQLEARKWNVRDHNP